MQVEEKNYLREPIKWSRSLDAEFPYHTVYDGNRLKVRVNDFPEQNFYTLIVNDNEVADFDDWPVNWIRSEDGENSHQETFDRRQIIKTSQRVERGSDFLPLIWPTSQYESIQQFTTFLL